MRHWPMWVLAILIVVVMVGGSVFWYSQDRTAPLLKLDSSWSTYKNAQFAFEVSYPPGWRARESAQGVLIRNYTGATPPKKPVDIDFRYFQNDNPRVLSPGDYISERYEAIKSLFSEAKETRVTTLANYPAIEYIWENDYAGSGYAPAKKYGYYITRDKDVLNITYVLQEGEDNSNEQLLLSTLKFTSFDQQTYEKIVQSENDRVAGADEDNNGVWDYIDTWINENYANNPNAQKAFRMLAKSLQFDMLNYRDKNAIIDESKKDHSVECVLRALPNDRKIIGAFGSVVFNTKPRLMAHFEADGQKSGQVYGILSQEQLSQYCGF